MGRDVLEYLVRDFSEPIRDPVWKNIALSRPLLRLVELPAFQKMGGVKQLGPTYLVYPGATHTRLNHSLGVVHLARRMIQHLLMNGTATVGQARVPRITLEGVKAFLCAALLHDVGHYPYAHSLKELEVATHESLTAARISEADFSRVIRDELGTDPALVAAIVDPQRSYGGTEELQFYRNLLSGVLDPDKLDYLNRDAYFCGVPYGVQDVDFVFAEIRIHSRGLAVTEKGLTAVESVLFSKYLMYRSVYWHKTVRIATAMIKKAVLLGLTQGVLSPSELYWLDDQEFYTRTREHGFPPFQLIPRVAERRLYKQIATVPFREENPFQSSLRHLETRLELEARIAAEASRLTGAGVPAHAVIIDIPEPIRFEIDVPVVLQEEGRTAAYHESPSVFTPRIVGGFGGALRRISLIAEVDPELQGALARMGPQAMLEGGL
jgi:HD superfamily phosphohydrolase